MKKRLINPDYLPGTLWNAVDKCLLLPPSLADAYRKLIDLHDLTELADSRDVNNPPVGGLTKEKTDEHFAQAFDGSIARTQLALLDPNSDISHVSDAFVRSMAGNSLAIIDAPAGAGAAALAFLTVIAELRKEKILPREPLDVALISAEISEPAREYAQQLLEEVSPALEEQAVFVSASYQHWDVTDKLSNTDLVQQLNIHSAQMAESILVIANFNGFLEQEKKRKEAAPQIEELFRHASSQKSMAIWIEPAMNRVTKSGGLFTWLRKQVQEAWKKFAKEHEADNKEDDTPIVTTNSRFHLPLKLQDCANVRLAVMAIELSREK
ncbi:MAG: hypothetical protein ABW146_13835 [Candidatus Sedimenticola sp. 6PFRAG7]